MIVEDDPGQLKRTIFTAVTAVKIITQSDLLKLEAKLEALEKLKWVIISIKRENNQFDPPCSTRLDIIKLIYCCWKAKVKNFHRKLQKIKKHLRETVMLPSPRRSKMLNYCCHCQLDGAT